MKFTNVFCAITMCTAATATMSPEEPVTCSLPAGSLCERLAIPVTDEAITLAREIIKDATKAETLRLGVTSKIAECLFCCMEDNPVLVEPIQTLASYLVTHAYPKQMAKLMEFIEGRRVAGDHGELQQRCNEIIIDAARWIRYDENLGEAALVQQVYDAEPGRAGWQRQMNRMNKEMFAVELCDLLKKQGDCRRIELKGRSAWLEHVNQLLDIISSAIPDPAERLIKLITKTLNERLATSVTDEAIDFAMRIISGIRECGALRLEEISGAVDRMLGRTEESPVSVLPQILASYAVTHMSPEQIIGTSEKIERAEDHLALQQAHCRDIIAATRWICGLEHPTAIALIRHIYKKDRVEQQQQMNREFVISLYELLGGRKNTQKIHELQKYKLDVKTILTLPEGLVQLSSLSEMISETIRRATSTPSAGSFE